MNEKSVSYIYASKQQEILNDPWELGSQLSKELTKMTHEQSLESYAEELVQQYAKYCGESYELSLESLSETDRNELTRLYIESIDREIDECIFGDDFSKNNEFTCALLSMLKNNSLENRRRFAEATRANVLLYYRDSIQEVINNACDNHFSNLMEENDMISSYDRDHGDLVWSKR